MSTWHSSALGRPAPPRRTFGDADLAPSPVGLLKRRNSLPWILLPWIETFARDPRRGQSREDLEREARRRPADLWMDPEMPTGPRRLLGPCRGMAVRRRPTLPPR